MRRPLLEDAFGHHVWATLRVLDACRALTEDQLATAVPGTYGSMLSTLRHLVGGDSWYLSTLTRGRSAEIDEDGMGLPDLRAAMERNASAWTEVVAAADDPDAVFVAHS